MIKEYKVESKNSTVCGYPGRQFHWEKFGWKGEAVYQGKEHYKSPKPRVDNLLIAENCQYLHVPYNFEEHGTIYRVRPNLSMRAGRKYRGRKIIRQTAVEKEDGWYWVLELKD